MRRVRISLVLSWVLAFNCALVLAQDNQIKFERLGVEHGLSQSSIFRILQDRRGFMWFGTEDGLNR